ncbi:MAG TPA: hypothetical protein VEZ11_11515, partial [Thermoanaerobaculia bacterium]|nr:hypothetical protein [Thermoanaerobaculia bacterium]
MTASASPRNVTGRTVAGGLATVALLAYFALLVRHTCFVAGGADSSGYLNEARAIAAGHITERVAAVDALNLQPADAEVFVPLGIKPGPRTGTMVPGYPPGLPLHMAAAALIGGWRIAPFLVSPLAAIGSLILLFILAGQLALPFGYRLGAAAVLAACPVFVFQAIQPMSDVVATFWTLAA